MEVYYTIIMFVLGTVLGSFYNVVGFRLPRGESLIKPNSHCPKCNHELTPLELIPVFSYLIQGGKCKKCHNKISLFYPIFELTSGLLFAGSYLIFGFSLELLLVISFISMLLIIIISDYQTMIIPDEVLLFFTSLIIVELLIKNGFYPTFISILNGIIAFVFMFLLKKFGDFLFKKESMGGGDIKLMFIFGLYFGAKTAILSVFLASFIGLPIALVILKSKKNHEIPFGPFLAISAIILTLTQFSFDTLIDIMMKF